MRPPDAALYVAHGNGNRSVGVGLLTLDANGVADGNEPPADPDFLEKVAHAVAPAFDAPANGGEPDSRSTTAADASRDADPKDER